MADAPRIRILPDHVANQIAAGEVVERPASVLKELVENALDAGATSLDIAWEEGGRKLLEIADDGSGMARDDLYLALERHATSKIKAAQDLQALESYGFRGEALPSIASVSRLELHSSSRDGDGHRLRSEFGVIRDGGPAPRARGTSVAVRDLFMQLPARRRFLKTIDTEHAHLWATATRLALATPSVRWAIRTDKSGELALPAVQDLKDRIVSLSGERMSRLFPFSDGEAPWLLHGYLSPPDLSYRDRNHLHLFVNGRPVRDRLMLAALSNGWDGIFSKGTFPAVALFLDVPPEAVDVNVHPTKSEVRFREPQRIFPWISRATGEAWRTSAKSVPGYFKGHSLSHDASSGPGALSALKQAFPSGASPLDRPYAHDHSATSAAEEINGFSAAGPPIRYLGVFAKTYLLAEYRAERENELWIIDQHAAHERVLYEQLFLRRHRPVAQPLLQPKVIEIGPAAMARLGPFMEEMRSIGIEVEAFGEGSLVVRALPDFLASREPEALVGDLLGRMEAGRCAGLDDFRKSINAELACRSAIKKNHELDPAQAQYLLDALMACQSPLTCPHGRPTVKKISLNELGRGFGRL
jgi:DNA mismatch repair protein MutL